MPRLMVGPSTEWWERGFIATSRANADRDATVSESELSCSVLIKSEGQTTELGFRKEALGPGKRLEVSERLADGRITCYGSRASRSPCF
jgi:hypothetical protein